MSEHAREDIHTGRRQGFLKGLQGRTQKSSPTSQRHRTRQLGQTDKHTTNLNALQERDDITALGHEFLKSLQGRTQKSFTTGQSDRTRQRGQTDRHTTNLKCLQGRAQHNLRDSWKHTDIASGNGCPRKNPLSAG